MSLFSFPGANGDGAAEIDEGFVEEFCEGEDALALPRGVEEEPNSELTRPLNMQEIQQLLGQGEPNVESDCSGMIGVPTSSFLDDFDLGVDVLDSEQAAQSEVDSSQPLKSPVAQVPSGPYLSAPIPIQSPVGMGLPPCSSPMGMVSPVRLDLNSYSDMLTVHQSDHELVGSFPDYGSVSSSSGIACSEPVSHGEELDMLCSVCDGFDMEINGMSLGEPCRSPAPSVSSVCSSVHPQNSLTGFMLDQTHCINLSELSHGGLHSLMPPCGSPSPSTPVREKTFDFGRGTLPLPMDPKSSGIKWEGGPGSVASRGSQTSRSTSRSPSPSPYITSAPLTPSSISSLPGGGATGSGAGPSPGVPKLVDMPFYQFKKILDSDEVSEADKNMAKTIRRRGKNKAAAKNCRQRKLDMIEGLQSEIDKLKVAKVRVEVRVQSLQKEIEAVRKRCALVERSRLNS